MAFEVQQSRNLLIAFLLLGAAVVQFLLMGFLVVNGIITGSWQPYVVGILCLGLLFLLSLTLGIGALAYGILFKKTLRVGGRRIQFLHGSKVVGQIPFANLVEIKVLREADQDYGAAGGLLGALAGSLAEQRKAQGNGLAFIIDDCDDRHTVWPASWRRTRFELRLTAPMEMAFQDIFDELDKIIPKGTLKQLTATTEQPVQRSGQRSQPEDNPFDFS